MKISRAKLQRIVREEMGRLRRRKMNERARSHLSPAERARQEKRGAELARQEKEKRAERVARRGPKRAGEWEGFEHEQDVEAAGLRDYDQPIGGPLKRGAKRVGQHVKDIGSSMAKVAKGEEPFWYKAENKIRVSEGALRRMIREELSEMHMVDPFGMPSEKEEKPCPFAREKEQGAAVDKHGSLANPPQEPLEKAGDDLVEPPLGAYTPGMEWESPERSMPLIEDEDEEEDILLGRY